MINAKNGLFEWIFKLIYYICKRPRKAALPSLNLTNIHCL